MYVVEQLSYKDIARRQGVTAQSVMRWLRAAGIPPRSKSEATSIAQKGKPLSEKQRANAAISIKKASAARRPEHFAAQAEKMKGRPPPNKGVPWTDAQRASHAYRQTDEYRAKQSELRKGEKSHNWKGGQTSAETCRMQGWEWRKRRAEVYVRDDWTCQDCGCKCLSKSRAMAEPKRTIQCHHIISRRNGGGDEFANLVTLCLSCHHKREAKGAAALFV
jgi:hypothetical protein